MKNLIKSHNKNLNEAFYLCMYFLLSDYVIKQFYLTIRFIVICQKSEKVMFFLIKDAECIHVSSITVLYYCSGG